MERTTDVIIIGAGSGGLYALGQIRRRTQDFLVINDGPWGTTCARVGCMPSKGLIQAGEDLHRGQVLDQLGIRGGAGLTADLPAVLGRVRTMRDRFVERVVAGSADRLGAHRIDGRARILAPDVVEVNGERIRARRALILATGSAPVIPTPWQGLRHLLLTTDELFEQEDLPGEMAVLGLGAIGLELGQALGRLGIKISGFDQAPAPGGLRDPEVSAAAVELLGGDLELCLGMAAELAEEDGRLRVRAGERELLVDRALCAVGRAPLVEGLGLENLGVPLDRRGLPDFDPATMQVAGLPVFMAGDITGDRALLHEAGDEGRIAGFNAVADQPRAFRRKIAFGIAFCDPNLVSVGIRYNDLEQDGVAVGSFDFSMQGRALLMARGHGLLRVYARKTDGLLMGAEMAVPHGEHLGHLLAWAIQEKRTVHQLLRLPFYHPVLEEGLQSALYAAHDQCGGGEEDGLAELQSAD